MSKSKKPAHFPIVNGSARKPPLPRIDPPYVKKVPFRAFYDAVLLDPLPRNMTDGGVALPENADMGPQRARVVAVGDGWPTDDGKSRMPMEVKVGDIVYCTFMATPHQIRLDNHTFVIVRMKDMVGAEINTNKEPALS